MDMNDMEMMKLNKFAAMSENGEGNRVACITSTVLNAVIALAYLMEGVKGNRTWGYVAGVGLLILLFVNQ